MTQVCFTWLCSVSNRWSSKHIFCGPDPHIWTKVSAECTTPDSLCHQVCATSPTQTFYASKAFWFPENTHTMYTFCYLWLVTLQALLIFQIILNNKHHKCIGGDIHTRTIHQPGPIVRCFSIQWHSKQWQLLVGIRLWTGNHCCFWKWPASVHHAKWYFSCVKPCCVYCKWLHLNVCSLNMFLFLWQQTQSAAICWTLTQLYLLFLMMLKLFLDMWVRDMCHSSFNQTF